tara:strand:+ start:3447 stop:3857 length:411 start_codon:yes stop_codon:yes gene_type:complete
VSESSIIEHCLECGSFDIVKTINGTCKDHFHCHTCNQEYFESVNYDTATITAFRSLEAELKLFKQYYKESKDALEFYGDKDRWVSFYSSDKFASPKMHRNSSSDFEFYDDHFKRGGGGARQFLNSDLIKEIDKIRE